MTQVDLQPLASVCVVGDLLIADDESQTDEPSDHDIPESTTIDCPPESFWLSKDAEFDWFDRNAFLERKESIKGNSNSMNLNPIVNSTHSNANSTSLHISAFLQSKAVQKTNYVDPKRRNCKLANILLFPKRSDSISKEPVAFSMKEPSSPKVSCLGRVRSKTCHRRRKVNNEPEKPANRHVKGQKKVRKIGFVTCIQSLFGSDCHGGGIGKKSLPEVNDPSEYSSPRRNNITLATNQKE
ncbi:hypothetical protein QVD17_22627 [Tagetes erecta]|uniref:Uncharacterized protein n=1 Tax=Tagetes erecta TaxID=13708 RepID=A0AAD8KD53_TARER|nr:hypothetical protein QVD17_22627 [Tagetes erecta]